MQIRTGVCMIRSNRLFSAGLTIVSNGANHIQWICRRKCRQIAHTFRIGGNWVCSFAFVRDTRQTQTQTHTHTYYLLTYDSDAISYRLAFSKSHSFHHSIQLSLLQPLVVSNFRHIQCLFSPTTHFYATHTHTPNNIIQFLHEVSILHLSWFMLEVSLRGNV